MPMLKQPNAGAIVDWDDPLVAGLVGWWLLNEGGGAKALNLVLPAGVGTVTGTVPTLARSGIGRSFNGTSDKVVASAINSAVGQINNSLTFACWVNRSGAGANNNAFGALGASSYYVFLGHNGGLGNFAMFDGSNNPVVAAGSITSAAWHLLVGVRDKIAGTLRLYLDGVSVGSTSDTTTGTNSYSSINIGGTTTLWFAGGIENCRVWGRALSAAEILRLYNEPYAGALAYRSRHIATAAAGPTPYTVRVIQGRGFSVPQLVRAASKILSHPVGNLTPLASPPRVITSKPPAVTPAVRGKPSIVIRPAPTAATATATSPHRVIAAVKNAIAPWFTRGKVASPRAGALIAIPKHQTIRSGPPAVRPIDRRSSATRPAAGAAAIVPVVHRVVRSGPPPVKAIDRKSIVARPASSATPPVIPPARRVIRSILPAVPTPRTQSRATKAASSATPPIIAPRHRSIASSLRVLVRTIARVWRGEIGGPAPIVTTVRAKRPTSVLFADLATSVDFPDLSTTLYYLNDDGELSMFPLQFKQGTTGPVTFPLLGADGTPKDLTGAQSVTMTVTKPNGTAIIAARSLTVAGAPTLGQVTWTRLAADTAVDGGYDIEVRVVNADGTIEKFPDPDSAELVITPSPTL